MSAAVIVTAPGDVEPAGRGAPGRRQQPQREREDERADRDVDEEDPVPAEQVREDPTGQDAGHAAAREDEPEDPHRLGALGCLGEERDHQRERDGGHECAAEALHGAHGHEQLLRRGEAAAERGAGEDPDPDQEELPVAEEVAEASTEEEESAEGQEVRVDHPRERRLREPEVVADRRQRDVHDRPVEDDHQVAQAEDVQGEPAFPSVKHLSSLRGRSAQF